MIMRNVRFKSKQSADKQTRTHRRQADFNIYEFNCDSRPTYMEEIPKKTIHRKFIRKNNASNHRGKW